jgi:SAM-dependent methyltransferase
MTTGPDDAWASGAAYDEYMGRWSRAVARVFIDWLCPKPSARWLEVGCGTGALSSVICERCEPTSLVACDPSEPFVSRARCQVSDERASFVVAGADALPSAEGGFDIIASGLVLNFLPDPGLAVASMRERLRPGGVVAAYVWDYLEDLEFLRHFWDEAALMDSRAAALDEGRRFPLCQATALASLFGDAGLAQVATAPLGIAMDFADFDDYWRPFLGGTGPAPTYVASLDPARRESLRARLERRLRPEPDGRIHLRAKAWAVRGLA